MDVLTFREMHVTMVESFLIESSVKSRKVDLWFLSHFDNLVKGKVIIPANIKTPPA